MFFTSSYIIELEHCFIFVNKANSILKRVDVEKFKNRFDTICAIVIIFGSDDMKFCRKCAKLIAHHLSLGSSLDQ